MFWEKKFHLWLAQMRSETRLPVRVRLWNGSQFDLGISAPEVTIRIPSPSSLIFLLNPSLESLGRAYVEGKLEVEGRLQAIIEVAKALSEKGLATGSRLGQLFKPRAHTRSQDKSAIEYHYDVSNEFYQKREQQ